jgi:hypothetical protein
MTTADSAAQSALDQFRLAAADELVSDVALGRKVRRFLADVPEAAPPERLNRPANVIDLVGWLEARARSGQLTEA